jgi:hypothetical protein
MAQWKTPAYDARSADLAAALRLLRTAADAWAFRGATALDVDLVCAAVVRALVKPFLEMPLSLTACLDQVDSTTAECTVRGHVATPDRVAIVVNQLLDMMAAAARGWALGDPEQPPTACVLRALADALFRNGLVRHPPPLRIEG